MKVVFRTDASLQIGTGHVARCLALAQALRQRGATCRFVCRDHPGNLIERIRQSEFEALVLPMNTHIDHYDPASDQPVLEHAPWLGSNWQTDAVQTKAAIVDFEPDWLVVDHYALDQRWEASMRSHCKKIMVIDDLADRSHDCDLLLDQNLVESQSHRYNSLVPLHCVSLIGPVYALLQHQYAELHSITSPRSGPVRRILVSFGGIDSQNLTKITIESFLALKRSDIFLDVVANPASPYLGELREQVRSHSNITLHEGLLSLAELMVQSDLAVGAGGTTTWERLCLGLPSITITVARNQQPIAASLAQRELIRWIGDHESVTIQALSEALDLEIGSPGLEAWSIACRELVDGRGAERTARIIGLSPSTPIRLRLACLADQQCLFDWANDPVVRANSFNPAPISLDTHERWFHSRLENTSGSKLYIAETKDNLPIGQVRFERRGDKDWEIHYGLWVGARRMGFGARIVELGLEKLRENHPEVRVLGYVKPKNIASQSIFKNLGFSCVREDTRFVYILPLYQSNSSHFFQGC